MSVTKKPIAVIAHSLSNAIDTMRTLVIVREINGAKRRIVDNRGQVFLIVTSREHLLGHEFADFIVAPGAGSNPNFKEIYDELAGRIR